MDDYTPTHVDVVSKAKLKFLEPRGLTSGLFRDLQNGHMVTCPMSFVRDISRGDLVLI